MRCTEKILANIKWLCQNTHRNFGHNFFLFCFSLVFLSSLSALALITFSQIHFIHQTPFWLVFYRALTTLHEPNFQMPWSDKYIELMKPAKWNGARSSIELQSYNRFLPLFAHFSAFNKKTTKNGLRRRCTLYMRLGIEYYMIIIIALVIIYMIDKALERSLEMSASSCFLSIFFILFIVLLVVSIFFVHSLSTLELWLDFHVICASILLHMFALLLSSSRFKFFRCFLFRFY